MLAELASSRAGSLPHLICVEHKLCAHYKSTVGASLLARASAATPLNRGFVSLLPLHRPRLNHIQNGTPFAHQQMHCAGDPRQVKV